MAKITVELPNGKTDDFVHAYGITFDFKHLNVIPNRDLKSQIENVRDIEIRDDDIFLATFPKCGTHWAWEILLMLTKGKAEYETKKKETSFLDFGSPEIIGNIQSPRVLNSHFPCKLIPREIIEKGTKIIHVMRNPKDAFVSFYHHMKANLAESFAESFQDFLPLMMGDHGIYMVYSWFEYVKEWERFSKQHPDQILNLFFEDMKEDPVREIKRMNEFLGTGRSDTLIRQIAESCDFKNLKKADAEIKVHNNVVDKKYMPVMFRKGEVGDWKNHFTVAQNERMDKWLEENLIDTDLKFRYTL